MTLDLNTVLNVVVLGLCAWTLKTVHEMAKSQAGAVEHARAQDSTIAENRSRIIGVEERVGGLEVDVGRLQAGHRR